MLRRASIFVFGIVSYVVFFATFLYAIAWVGGFLVPTAVDGEPTMPLVPALLIDLGLLTLFALQHSVMARPAFKRAWTQIVPQEIERSVYVLASSLCLIAMFVFWQPLGGVIWEIENTLAKTILYAIFGLGFGIVLVSTFLINHFDLFGLRQVWFALRKRDYVPVAFVEPFLYRMVRHPLYVGFILGFWATPRMTAAHLVFAIMTTVYILIAIQLEERDLIAEHGDSYRDYRAKVPMIIPGKPVAPSPKPMVEEAAR